MPFIGKKAEDGALEDRALEILEKIAPLKPKTKKCRNVTQGELVDGDRWLQFGDLRFDFFDNNVVEVSVRGECVMRVAIGDFFVFANTLHDYTHHAFYDLAVPEKKRLERDVDA